MQLSPKKSHIQQQQLMNKLQVQYLEQQYEFLGQIGRGSFAKVLKARQKNGSGEIKAIKRIQINPLTDEISEIQNLKVLKNDHIIEFYGYIIQNNQLNIIMQLCKGSLRDQIKKKKDFNPNRLLQLIVQVTSAMVALSEKNIMHLDLKPQNILYEHQHHYRICDFGCSQLFACISRTSPNVSARTMKITDTVFGTPQYISPEIQLGKNRISRSSCDVWSFGVILYQLIYKKHPFQLQKNHRVNVQDLKNFISGKKNIEFSQTDPKYPIDLIKQMLKPSPSQRISWNKIKQYLIKNLGKQQAQFLNLQYAADNQLKLSLIQGSLIQQIRQKINILVDEEQRLNINQFWLNNIQQVLLLKQLLIELSHAQISHFCRIFDYKIRHKLSEQMKLKFAFLLDHLKQQKQTIIQAGIKTEHNCKGYKQIQELLMQLLVTLQQRLVQNQNNTQDQSINKLLCFIEQAKKSRKLFCNGDQFQKCCQLFNIKQDE